MTPMTMPDLLLTRLELRVLRAVDDRPGVTALAHVCSTGISEEIILMALEHLERAQCVRATRIGRGGPTWRTTRRGVDELIRRPQPPRRHDPGLFQLELAEATR